MHLGEHLLEQSLERPVLGTLVELADEVAACLEGVACEGESGFAEILLGGRGNWQGVLAKLLVSYILYLLCVSVSLSLSLFLSFIPRRF